MAKRNMLGGDLCTSRDLFVTMQDILNVSCKIEDFAFHTNVDDAVGVHNWVKDNHEQVFFYQQVSSIEDKPFILGIQTKWQLNIMIKYGHNSLLAMDSTFGTNKYKVNYNVYITTLFLLRYSL